MSSYFMKFSSNPLSYSTISSLFIDLSGEDGRDRSPIFSGVGGNSSRSLRSKDTLLTFSNLFFS